VEAALREGSRHSTIAAREAVNDGQKSASDD
jgi:hypothetical protein